MASDGHRAPWMGLSLNLPPGPAERAEAALARLGRVAAGLLGLDLGLVLLSDETRGGSEAGALRAVLPRPFTPAGLLELTSPAGRYRGLTQAGWHYLAAHPVADADGLVAGALIVLGRQERAPLGPQEAGLMAGLAGVAGDVLALNGPAQLALAGEGGPGVWADLPGLLLVARDATVTQAGGRGWPGLPGGGQDLVGQPLAAVFDDPAALSGHLEELGDEGGSFPARLRGQDVTLHALPGREATRLLVLPAPPVVDDAPRQVLDLSPVGYALLGMDGRAVWTNRTLRGWLGWPDAPPESLGPRLVEFPNGFSGAQDWPEFLQLVAGRRAEYTVARDYTRADGTRFPAVVTVRLLPGEDGQPDRVLQVVQPAPAAPVNPGPPGTDLDEARRQAVNEERLRIARELHDGLGKDLYGLALLLEAVSERQKGRAVAQELLEYAEMTRKLANQGRALLRTFRDPDAIPLVKRLQVLAANFEETAGARLTLETSRLPDLTGGAAFELERITQEALENARRHAQARQVTVTLTEQNDALVLEVRDDGRGLPENVPGMSEGHFGLVGMRERAQLLGGHLSVTRLPEGGTLVRGVFPMQALREVPDGR